MTDWNIYKQQKAGSISCLILFGPSSLQCLEVCQITCNKWIQMLDYRSLQYIYVYIHINIWYICNTSGVVKVMDPHQTGKWATVHVCHPCVWDTAWPFLPIQERTHLKLKTPSFETCQQNTKAVCHETVECGLHRSWRSWGTSNISLTAKAGHFDQATSEIVLHDAACSGLLQRIESSKAIKKTFHDIPTRGCGLLRSVLRRMNIQAFAALNVEDKDVWNHSK